MDKPYIAVAAKGTSSQGGPIPVTLSEIFPANGPHDYKKRPAPLLVNNTKFPFQETYTPTNGGGCGEGYRVLWGVLGDDTKVETSPWVSGDSVEQCVKNLDATFLAGTSFGITVSVHNKKTSTSWLLFGDFEEVLEQAKLVDSKTK